VTAPVQGIAGLALVMCFGLLGTRQVGTASILLAIQSVAVAIAALGQHQPLIAAATAAINVIGARWLFTALHSGVAAGAAAPLFRAKSYGLIRRAPAEFIEQSPAEPIGQPPAGPVGRQAEQPARRAHRRRLTGPPDERSGRPIGRAKLGIALGAGLAVLCQSSGPLAMPLAIVLLSVLLAAERRNPLMRLIALVSLQNGITLAACLTVHPSLQSLACFVLPLPMATALALGDTAGRNLDIPNWFEPWFGWTQLAVSVGLFVASLMIPLDPLAAVFAPLMAAWGMAEAWAARNRIAQSVAFRGAALAKLGFMLAAVGATQPVVAWLAVVGAISAAMVPALRRRWDGVLLAFCAAGLGLFGLLTIPSGLPSVSCTALFLGCAAIVGVVPELGIVIVVVIMRLMMRTHPPPIAGTVLISVAIAGLLGCSVLLAGKFAWQGFRAGVVGRSTDPHRVTLMQLAQTAIAAIAVGLGQPESRFAAVVLLILLTLTRIAARISCGPAAATARAGLAGIPPFGVFPGVVLILLTISREAAWLLLPIGSGLAATLAVGVASTRIAGFPSTWTWDVFHSLGLLPLALAFLFGFFAPDYLVDWLRAATAGVP